MEQSHTDAAELAALYVSGALTREEKRAVEAELAAGNEALAREVARLEPVARGLAGTARPLAPDPATRESLMQYVAGLEAGRAAQVWRSWSGDEERLDLFTLRAAEGVWEQTGVDGISVRRLFVDQANNRMTALFRMEPGAQYIPHVHDGPEECYVLEGDLRVDDETVMRTGDYQRAPAGSRHGVQRTEHGCLLLVTCSLHDEPN